VNILNGGAQPDNPTVFRRDETRTLMADFPSETYGAGQTTSFSWTIKKTELSPFSISQEGSQVVYDTLELNIGRKMLSTGFKVVVFELRIAGESLSSRDFAFLQVKESALVASIAGGTEVARSITKPIILDGTASYDPENGAGILYGISFYWSSFFMLKNASDANRTNTESLDADMASDLDITPYINHSIAEYISDLAKNNSVETIAEYSSNIPEAVANSTDKKFLRIPDSAFESHPEAGKVILNISKLVTNNKVYYVLLIVRKKNRTASFVQTIHVYDNQLIDIRLR